MEVVSTKAWIGWCKPCRRTKNVYLAQNLHLCITPTDRLNVTSTIITHINILSVSFSWYRLRTVLGSRLRQVARRYREVIWPLWLGATGVLRDFWFDEQAQGRGRLRTMNIKSDEKSKICVRPLRRLIRVCAPGMIWPGRSGYI